MTKILFLILIPFCSFSQEFEMATFEKASDEIYAEILMTEHSLENKDFQNWIIAEQIVCLSGIKPKIWDHQYSGISYKPTIEELKKWKAWFKKNEKNLKYFYDQILKRQIIILENSIGEIKRSDCGYNQ